MATLPTRELKIGAIIDKSLAVLERVAMPALIFVVALTVVNGVIDYFTANAAPLSQLAVTPLKIVIGVYLIGRQDAVLTVDREDGDRDHQIAGKLEGVGLDEGEIVGHGEELHPGAGQSRSMAPQKDRGRSRSPRRRMPKRRQLASRPLAG